MESTAELQRNPFKKQKKWQNRVSYCKFANSPPSLPFEFPVTKDKHHEPASAQNFLVLTRNPVFEKKDFSAYA